MNSVSFPEKDGPKPWAIYFGLVGGVWGFCLILFAGLGAWDYVYMVTLLLVGGMGFAYLISRVLFKYAKDRDHLRPLIDSKKIRTFQILVKNEFVEKFNASVMYDSDTGEVFYKFTDEVFNSDFD